jgi:hypothetical protein
MNYEDENDKHVTPRHNWGNFQIQSNCNLNPKIDIQSQKYAIQISITEFQLLYIRKFRSD